MNSKDIKHRYLTGRLKHRKRVRERHCEISSSQRLDPEPHRSRFGNMSSKRLAIVDAIADQSRPYEAASVSS